MLFNKILGENEKRISYFHLKLNELFGQPNKSKRRKIWDPEIRESTKQRETKDKTVKEFQDGNQAAGPKSNLSTLKKIWGLP